MDSPLRPAKQLLAAQADEPLPEAPGSRSISIPPLTIRSLGGLVLRVSHDFCKLVHPNAVPLGLGQVEVCGDEAAPWPLGGQGGHDMHPQEVWSLKNRAPSQMINSYLMLAF